MEHILLIEDNLADIELITSYLELAGFTHRLFKAQSLQDGLEIIRHNRIDIILLDLGLDDTTGTRTLRSLFDDVHNIPVIVLTGNSNELLGMQIIRAGAQDYLVKGEFESKQLLRAIRYAMRRHLTQVEMLGERWKLRHQQQRFHQLHKLAAIGEWELDVLDNTMQWSDEMYQILGYQAQSFAPKLSDYLRTVSTEERELVNQVFQEEIKNGKVFFIEHRALINNHIVKYFHLRGQVIAEESSGKILLIGILQDVTGLKNSLAAPNGKAPNTSASSNAIDKSKAILKPLHQLWQCIEVLKNQETHAAPAIWSESEEALHQLTELLYEQMHASVLSNPVLPVRPELISWSDWKSNVEKLLLAKGAHGNIIWIPKWQEQLPPQIYADLQLLSLLIFNLMNLMQHPIRGKEMLPIHFGGKNIDATSFDLHINLVAPEVSIALNKRKEISERIRSFLQTERSYPTEEGLRHSMQAITKILKALRGHISISRKHDIELHIPLEKKEAIKINGAAKKPSTVNMLVIEHQTILQMAIRRMLKADYSELNLDFVTDAESGIQKYEQNTYDLLLIDLHLPNTNLFELIQKFTNSKVIPILAIASEFVEADKLRLHSLGVKTYLSKPLQREALTSAISDLLKN